MSESARGAALVVGGSSAERDRWQAALAGHLCTDAARDAAGALDQIGPATEILLVHRELPDESAAGVVAAARDDGATVRAALLTPVTPEGNVVALGFDAWLRTPVDAELLARTVEGLLACRAYDRAIADLYELATETAGTGDSPRGRVEAARAEADAALAAVETIDREALLANSPAAFEDG
jgi:hypothetical protein